MLSSRFDSFRWIAVFSLGAAICWAPAPSQATTNGTGTSFIAEATGASTNGNFPEINRIENQQRQSLLNKRFSQFSIDARGGDPRVQTTWFGTPQVGMPAGDSSMPNEKLGDWFGRLRENHLNDRISLWVSSSYTDSEFDFTGARWDSESYNVSWGGDYKWNDDLIVGIFTSYADTDTDTGFNNGKSESEMWSFGPYVSYVVNDFISVDASVGYSDGEIDNERAAGTITGNNQNSHSWFASGNINGSYWLGNLGLGARTGFIYSQSENDSYTDSTGAGIPSTKAEFAQWQVESSVSYYLESPFSWCENLHLMPYFKTAFNWDVAYEKVAVAARDPQNDEEEVLFSMGVSLFGNGGWSGGLDVSKSAFRRNFESWTASGSVSYRF